MGKFSILQRKIMVALLLSAQVNFALAEKRGKGSQGADDCESQLAQSRYTPLKRSEIDFASMSQIGTPSWNDKTLSFNLTDLKARYLIRQRQHIRDLYESLRYQYMDSEHAIKAIMLARLLKTNVFLYGPPGGAKSALARRLLNTPSLHIEDEKVVYRVSNFNVQFNQLTPDMVILGYVSWEERNADGSPKVFNENSLIKKKTVLADELDKINPATGGAFLQVLNEGFVDYGHKSEIAETETVVAALNTNPAEFLDIFRMQSQEKTAQALLDRFPIKVFVPNDLVDTGKRLELAQRNEKAYSKRLSEWQPKAFSKLSKKGESLSEEQKTTGEDEIDYDFLSSLIPIAGTTTQGTPAGTAQSLRSFIDTIVRETKKANITNRMENSKQRYEKPGEFSEYWPTQISSLRNQLEFFSRAVSASHFLDLVLAPDDKISPEQFVQLVSSGLMLDTLSAYRLKDILLTAAPGEAELKSDGGTLYNLEFDNQLNEIKELGFDRREQDTVGFIAAERDGLTGAFGDASRSMDLSASLEILAQVFGKMEEKQPSVELILQAIHQSQ